MNVESTATPPASESPASAAGTGQRRRLLLIVAFVVVAALLALGAYHWLVGRFHEDTDNAYVAGDIVSVTPQVGGMVNRILVEDTQRVTAGQVLIELDASDQRVARARAEAELARAVRDVEALYATTDALAAQAAASRAQVTSAEADATRADADLARRRIVAAEGGVSNEELLRAVQISTSADAQLVAARRSADAAQAQLAANRAQTTGTAVASHPRVLAASAAVREAVIAESRTKILAPVDGEIAKRAVSLGTQVAPGTPLLYVVPLKAVWVEANFKEGQLGEVHAGQPVTLTTDLYGGGVKYHGHVVGMSAGTGSAFSLLPAQNATGNWIKVVQRIPVRVELDPAELRDHPLRVGLSVSADIEVHEVSGAPVLATRTTGGVGTTRVYDDLERRAEQRVAEIIAAQRPHAEAHEAQPR
jgi:membrane fusion protein (multidrug efflux system)